MQKQILLINDLPGYGKVALSAMIPILSHMGHHLYNLPTALVSNTLDYGLFEILETTEYMKKTISVWAELKFKFEAISIGFVVSGAQANLILDYCGQQKKLGAKIFLDPIMGDDGKLYNGITAQTVSHMRRLLCIADYSVPNYTEATYLAGMSYMAEGLTRLQAEKLIKALRGAGAKSISVTSAKVAGQDCVIVYDDAAKTIDYLPFENIPVRFPGTGDIFSAVFMGNILNGADLIASTQRAMDTVRIMLEKNRANEDKYKGIPLESHLEVIKI